MNMKKEPDAAVKAASALHPRHGEEPRTALHKLRSDTEEDIDGVTFRRSRASLDYSTKLSLDIPKKYLNDSLYYRWVNDDGSGRVQKLREMGYEHTKIISETGEELSAPRRVGNQKNGTPLNAVLMATPKKWWEERQKIRDNARKSHEQEMFKGPVDNKGQNLGAEFYSKESTVLRQTGAT